MWKLGLGALAVVGVGVGLFFIPGPVGIALGISYGIGVGVLAGGILSFGWFIHLLASPSSQSYERSNPNAVHAENASSYSLLAKKDVQMTPREQTEVKSEMAVVKDETKAAGFGSGILSWLRGGSEPVAHVPTVAVARLSR